MTAAMEKAYAKLNLSLDVLGKRPDGFHDLRMVMQSAALCDDVHVTLTNGGFSAETDRDYIPCDDRNSALKAAKAFFAAAGIRDGGAAIRIKKRIPVCAGLGGGSSDAAAVLRALNRLTGAGLSARQLEAVAEGVGSDVPFCVSGGTALAQGRGERITPLPPLPACAVVICMPNFTASTPELFSRIGSRASRCRPDTDGMVKAIEAGDLAGVARRMYNVFEDVLGRRAADVRGMKNRLLDSGALGAVMSGTGSAVFGLFETDSAAAKARDALAEGCREVFLTRIQGSVMG
ncbi:MAG TPA: 4-(cytidine 5'-diphospho)-2-C-methyl-D-erythritol kinase [Clostridiales bacterium]|nr:4-(cytidine 5'-diphospho)-2-C-methyl-D-erythritol kinase [Clostridiales bacterium]